jgi:hypothetical protein
MTGTPCLQLPGFVVTMMNDLGVVDVPNGDICGMLKVASAWTTHGSQSAEPPQAALKAAEQIWLTNKSAAVDAFRKEFTGSAAPPANLADASTGATGIGIGLLACAGILVGLMVSDIAQVTALIVEIASAVAEAFVTFGASLLEILGFKETTTIGLNTAINTAAGAVMGH